MKIKCKNNIKELNQLNRFSHLSNLFIARVSVKKLNQLKFKRKMKGIILSCLILVIGFVDGRPNFPWWPTKKNCGYNVSRGFFLSVKVLYLSNEEVKSLSNIIRKVVITLGFSWNFLKSSTEPIIQMTFKSTKSYEIPIKKNN